MSSTKVIQIQLTFLDESEIVYSTNTTDRRAAVADFNAKTWLEIDGEFYNKALVFKWSIIGD